MVEEDDYGDESSTLLSDPGSGPAPAKKQDGFGAKSIGFFGSMCLLCNNICSAGMVQIPGVFQSAGWLFPTIIFIITSLLATYSSLFLCKTVAWMRGNRHFQRRVEFSGLAQVLFPKPLYLFTVCVLIFSFMSNNIAAIVVSAQVMDSTLIAIAHKTCALVVLAGAGNTSAHGPFTCLSEIEGEISDSPFGNDYVISIGFLVVMAAVVPLGYLNLDENMWVQVGGIVLLAACVFVWMAQFIDFGLYADRMPVVATGGFDVVLSSVVFNYGYVATVPSWLNEKGPRVSIFWSNIVAVVFATFLYFILGFFGGLGLPANGSDILSLIDGDHNSWTISKIGTYVFPIANLMSSIPVFSILIRYNLINSGLCKKHVANVFSVLLPWVLALFFYAGNQLSLLMGWSAAIFFVLLNFVIPLYMFIVQAERLDPSERHDVIHDESDTPMHALSQEHEDITYIDESHPHVESFGIVHKDAVYVLPQFIREKYMTELTWAKILFYFSLILAIAAFVMQIQTTQ